MPDFDTVIAQLEQLKRVEGMTITDVLQLPDTVGNLLRKIIRKSAMTMPEIAEELGLAVDESQRVCETLVEKGFLTENAADEARGDMIKSYRVYMARMRQRNIPDL
jgi:predicted ArsR family transcriptional regulator